jgi:NAD(P)-dependent dehydrogenase (short-subunit alcohol dehydrogenase family)
MSEKRLRILLVGASGTLGRAVAAELGQRHEVIAAGRNSGSVKIDLTDVDSIRNGLQQAGELDAVISAAGKVTFAPLADFKAASYGDSLHTLGIADKLLGQVNLALAARDHLRDGGSITLTTGILSEQPIVAGSSASLVNGAVEAFVRAAAIELPRGLRINVVSPNVLTEAMPSYAPFFRGFEPVSAARAALAFSRSVEGAQTGQVYKVF